MYKNQNVVLIIGTFFKASDIPNTTKYTRTDIVEWQWSNYYDWLR